MIRFLKKNDIAYRRLVMHSDSDEDNTIPNRGPVGNMKVHNYPPNGKHN
jgi:hypothetical protein